VGDPHYRTFDGISFDYQNTGEFILARHMNDIELQNKQVPCPNPSVRCNVAAAIITKDFNIQFSSAWLNSKVMVNGEMWTRGNQYQNCQWTTLDYKTKFYTCNQEYRVAYNDLKVGPGCEISGSMHPWSFLYYHNIYFNAPGRWSSGLSMTGLFGNFDNNAGDDWASIAPSTEWWVHDTDRSAFSNPKYLLSKHNRVRRHLHGTGGNPQKATASGGWLYKGHVVSLATMEKFESQKNDKINWSLDDEHKMLVEVDEVTAKMRRRLFEKMTKDGSIERRNGQAKPTTGLAGAELDIMPYKGERPDHLRVEQQILFRKEWKHLSKVQRMSMLAGHVASSNAAGIKAMCSECLKGEASCTTQGITYTDQAHKDLCHDVCLNWLKPEDTAAICKCWIDCGAGGMANKQLSDDAVDNYLSPRTLALIPAEGVAADRCISLASAAAKQFKAIKYRQKFWAPTQGTNFMLSFWWQPDKERNTGETAPKSLRSLVYKGVYPYTAMVPLHIEADLTSGSPPYVKVTVGGQSFRSANRLHESQFSFICVTKDDQHVKLYLGVGVFSSLPLPLLLSPFLSPSFSLSHSPFPSLFSFSLPLFFFKCLLLPPFFPPTRPLLLSVPLSFAFSPSRHICSSSHSLSGFSLSLCSSHPVTHLHTYKHTSTHTHTHTHTHTQDNSKDEAPVVDSWMKLKATDVGGDPYISTEEDSLYIVAPGVTKRENMGYTNTHTYTHVHTRRHTAAHNLSLIDVHTCIDACIDVCMQAFVDTLTHTNTHMHA